MPISLDLFPLAPVSSSPLFSRGDLPRPTTRPARPSPPCECDRLGLPQRAPFAHSAPLPAARSANRSRVPTWPQPPATPPAIAKRAQNFGSSRPSVCHAPFPPISPSSEGCISRVEDRATQSNLENELAAKQESLQDCVATPMTVSSARGSARDPRDVATF